MDARQPPHRPTPSQSRAGPPPTSDVSGAIGLVGLAGLAAWVLICRSYPQFAELFDWAGPRERMSGPYAALAALLFTSVPMVAWSVIADKVHRRASTGIDWSNPRPIGEILPISKVKILGLWATWAILGFLYCVARWYWSGQYLFAMEVIGFAAIPLVILSLPYVLWVDRVMIDPRDHAWHFGAMLLGRPHDIEAVKTHWRAWIIKGFFGAFMISILPAGFAAVVDADLADVTRDPVRFGLTMIALLFVIDVQIGTVGYLLTLRPLDAHIRSGNPFLSGWLAALICYPPLVFAFMGTNGMIAYEVNTAGWTHWFAGSGAMLWMWAGWLIVLTGIYAWATVVFGIRFSNLTYRGVITNGPYRYTRHPAYLAKNLFWWCATLPFLVTGNSMVDIVRNVFFLGCVSAIYYWRARTEEAHLLRRDARYRAYHAWMARHGVVTSRLARLVRYVRHPRDSALPAE
ncbi:MAG: isoprenylcysteine carboxylmethyltransferase family protein [Pontixanthobacter sp.]